MDGQTLPTDLGEVESVRHPHSQTTAKSAPKARSFTDLPQLILSLYQPNPPDVISRVQSALSQLQASPQAWALARDLLGRPDEKVKFFGALTVIIKLNKESSSLSVDDATELLLNLSGWYLDSLEQGSGPLVARKISSAVATFFLHFYRIWPGCLRHLVCCLACHEPLHPDAIDYSKDCTGSLEVLGPVKLRAALWVASNIVDDAAKFDLNAATNAGLYDAVVQNMPDAAALMRRCLSSEAPSPEIHEDSIRCLQSWVWFAQRASSRDSHITEFLKPLLASVINTLPLEQSDSVSMELLADVLSSNPTLLTPHDYDNLATLFAGPWFQGCYQTLVQGDFGFESIRFGQLLLAFGDARVHYLVQSDEERNQGLLDSLLGLLLASGYPVAEDRIFVPAVEFWSTFAEDMADFTYADEISTKPWATRALANILEAVSRAWRKIIYPPAEEFSQWDSSERVAFNDARKDVIDLLQSVYALAGPRLAATFADLMLSALSTLSWLPLEAAAFCLGGLSDCNRDDAEFDHALASVFASPLFAVLQEGDHDVPPKTRQTCISLIEKYADYFERHASLLSPALGLLFAMVGEQSVATSASKSVLRLCSSCRHHLYPEVGPFLDQYQDLVHKQKIDCVSRERIIGAIASVAQAIPDASDRNRACARILGFIQADVWQSEEMQGSSNSIRQHCVVDSRCSDASFDEHTSLHVGLRALRCLVSVGRAFQAPADVQIDLEAVNDAREAGSDSGLLQLQSGFSEDEPGPFVLPPKEIAHYLTSHTVDAPRIGVIVSTACSFISSLRPQSLPSSRELLHAVLLWVVGLLKQLPGPEFDPELSQNGIDFVSRLFVKSPAVFLRLQPPEAAEFFFLFSLQVLDGKEPLPKTAAAEFWSTFVNSRHEDVELQEEVKRAMDMLGPLLSQSLVRNIGGNASRSELEKLSEPLKKLVNRYTSSRRWLETALQHHSFPSAKVTEDQKSMFVKKIISLRGSRATNQVVRDFWLTARGVSFAYAS